MIYYLKNIQKNLDNEQKDEEKITGEKIIIDNFEEQNIEENIIGNIKKEEKEKIKKKL